jgi:hypothetical protein
MANWLRSKKYCAGDSNPFIYKMDGKNAVRTNLSVYGHHLWRPLQMKETEHDLTRQTQYRYHHLGSGGSAEYGDHPE